MLAAANKRWFWEYIGAGFSRELWQRRIFLQHRWLRQQVRRLKPGSILEVGCGFGRNLEYLIDRGVDPKILTGTDISRRLLRRVNLPVRLVRADARNLPFVDRQFDLVFTHGLLMHLPPGRLAGGLSELIRVSRKYLILIEEVRSRPKQLNYFTWAHDYDKIIASLPVKIVVKKRGQHSLIWYLLQK